MNREIQREEREHFTAYAQELAEKFNTGLLKELKPYRQFVVRKDRYIEGKKKKLPYNPHTHRLASPTDPSTWGTYQEALKALSTGLYNGIEFVFTETDPFIGIDLDHCVHGNRRIDLPAALLVRRLQSYSEYSDNDGLHVLIKAQAPFTTRRYQNTEVFASAHALSLTLRHVSGTPTAIEEREEELNNLLASFPNRGGEERPAPRIIWQNEPQQITEVEKRLLEHWKREHANFARYYEGDRRLWLGNKKEVYSKSEADFVLCLMLLTRTHDNIEQVKRFFRASGLFDPYKTDRPSGHDPLTGKPVTYLEMTIYNALKKRPKP